MKTFFAEFILTLLLFSQCRAPTTPAPCDTIKCTSTFICEEGICKCPAGTYNLQRECVSKSLSTYYSISDCACYDTLVMKLPAIIDSTTMQSILFSFNWRSEAKTGLDKYRRYNTGDTFWIFGFDLPRCEIKGVSAFPEIFGKISPSRDSISTTIYWHMDNVTIVDTCRKIFVR